EGRSGDVSPGVDGPPVMPKDPYAYVVAAFPVLPPPDYVPGPEEPKQAPPLPPLHAAASPTAESPGYIPESDPDEDPEEDDYEDPEDDPADYPADHYDDDDEEEPSGDDVDEEDEEQDEDNDYEEEEHPASADSFLPPPALHLLSSNRRADRPEVILPPRKRLNIVHYTGYEAGESPVAAATRPIEGHLVTALGEIRALQAREQARAGAPKGASSST
nr:hypothetical protein [Tanacetum cinerariifolium]